MHAASRRPHSEVYRACLDVIPHKSFTFAKIWLMLAKFEVRHKDLQAARKVLGQVRGRAVAARGAGGRGRRQAASREEMMLVKSGSGRWGGRHVAESGWVGGPRGCSIEFFCALELTKFDASGWSADAVVIP